MALWSALHRDSAVNYFVRIGALLGQSVPGFWLGIVLIILFAVQARLLPTSGRGTLLHLVLPSLTLAAYFVALLARVARAVLVEVLDETRSTARAKGVNRAGILLRHERPTRSSPSSRARAPDRHAPGWCRHHRGGVRLAGDRHLAVQAIFNRDYPLVQAIVLISAVMFVAINYCLDALYCVLDPRIRTPGRQPPSARRRAMFRGQPVSAARAGDNAERGIGFSRTQYTIFPTVVGLQLRLTRFEALPPTQGKRQPRGPTARARPCTAIRAARRGTRRIPSGRPAGRIPAVPVHGWREHRRCRGASRPEP